MAGAPLSRSSLPAPLINYDNIFSNKRFIIKTWVRGLPSDYANYVMAFRVAKYIYCVAKLKYFKECS